MKPAPTTWRLDRRINLSVLVQLAAMAALIVGSGLNLQRQLDLLQHDVTLLLRTQERLTQRLDTLATTSVAHEYRVQAIEKHIGDQP